MVKKYGRSAAVLLCLLVCSISAHAEVFGDLITKAHDWYVGIAAVLSVMLLVFVAFKGYASEHNRWSIWLGGAFLVYLLNVAGKVVVDWIPQAT